MTSLRQLDLKKVTDDERRMASIVVRKEEEKKKECNKVLDVITISFRVLR